MWLCNAVVEQDSHSSSQPCLQEDVRNQILSVGHMPLHYTSFMENSYLEKAIGRPEDEGENTLLNANMEGCHAIDRILGDRPGMPEQKTELVHHDAIGLFSQ